MIGLLGSSLIGGGLGLLGNIFGGLINKSAQDNQLAAQQRMYEQQQKEAEKQTDLARLRENEQQLLNNNLMIDNYRNQLNDIQSTAKYGKRLNIVDVKKLKDGGRIKADGGTTTDTDKNGIGLGGYLGIKAGFDVLSGLSNALFNHFASKNVENMYKNLKRKNQYVQVAREHITPTVNVTNKLSDIENSRYRLNNTIDTNTANSKVAYNRRKLNEQNFINNRNEIYTNKENLETQLRNKEAELQTQYNLVDTQNLIKEREAANNFEIQKTIGATNAHNQMLQGWGNFVGNTLNLPNKYLSDATKVGLTLAGSNIDGMAGYGMNILKWLGLDPSKLTQKSGK